MPDFYDKEAFIKRVNYLFKDEEEGKVGKIAAGIIDLIEGGTGQDAMCALAFVVSFLIDTNDDKRNSVKEFVEVVERFVDFDEPAFKSETLQ